LISFAPERCHAELPKIAVSRSYGRLLRTREELPRTSDYVHVHTPCAVITDVTHASMKVWIQTACRRLQRPTQPSASCYLQPLSPRLTRGDRSHLTR
jgi:hypothetical protein